MKTTAQQQQQQQIPLGNNVNRRTHYLNESNAIDLISHIQKKNFSVAREIVVDLHVTTKPSISHKMDNLLCQLFIALNAAGELEEFDWFIEHLIFDRKYASEKALSVIISIQLDERNDLNRATELFYRMAKEFKQTPWAHLLLTKLIQNGDEQNVERCLNAIKIVRPKLVRYSLAHAYTECGHIDKATEIYAALPIVEDFQTIDDLLTAVQNQRKVQFLQNFLNATKTCIPSQCRRQVFEKLITVLLAENDIEQLNRVCAVMVAEQLLPAEKIRNAIINVFAANNISIPNGWTTNYRWHMYQQQLLHSLLEQNRLERANAYYLAIEKECDIIGAKLTRFLLAKNAEKGNVTFFQQFREFHQHNFATKKHRLSFTTFECKAYHAADKSIEYIDCMRTDLEDLGRWQNNELLDISISVMDMIDTPHAYNQCKLF